MMIGVLSTTVLTDGPWASTPSHNNTSCTLCRTIHFAFPSQTLYHPPPFQAIDLPSPIQTIHLLPPSQSVISSTSSETTFLLLPLTLHPPPLSGGVWRNRTSSPDAPRSCWFPGARYEAYVQLERLAFPFLVKRMGYERKNEGGIRSTYRASHRHEVFVQLERVIFLLW